MSRKIKQYIILHSISLLFANAVFSQHKSALTEKDYGKWGFLVSDNISDAGNWVSFRMKYTDGDTLFLKHVASKRQYTLSVAGAGKFKNESYFACVRSDTLVLFDLKTSKKQLFPDCQFFEFGADGNTLYIISKPKENIYTLTISNLKKGNTFEIGKITSWKWNESISKLAYIYKNIDGSGIAVLAETNVTQPTIIKQGIDTFSGLSWGGDYLSFIERGSTSEKLFLYDSQKAFLKECKESVSSHIPQGMKFLGDFGFTIVSPDGKKVLFALSEPYTAEEELLVQIWNAQDKQLYPRKQMYGDVYQQHKFAIWFVEQDRVRMITDKQFPKGCGSINSNYALIWDPMQYEPQTDYDGPTDLYLMNILTGERELLLTKADGGIAGAFIDLHDNYVYYHKENNWWAYDINSRQHRNLTKNLRVRFDNLFYDRAGKRPMYGVGGFVQKSSNILIYDQFDIWELKGDGKNPQRLTNGRNDGTIYRLVETEPQHKRKVHGYENLMGVYNTDLEIMCSFINKVEDRAGFYKFKRKGKGQFIYSASQQLENLNKASNANVFTFTAQRYDLSPQLVMLLNAKKPTTIYSSNSHQDKYYWGKSELVHYEVDGKPLTGVLVFPAVYDPAKRYPMVVSIYEKQNYLLHTYTNPSLYNMTGFNPTNLSSKGYFILLPDIAYRMREMGDSAKDCVLAAVDAVLNKYAIDPKKLGLTGHSFGGYETDYIITQTDRFAVAVSGAAITDLVSSYLYVGGNHGRPDFWRFEHQQQRMEKSLYEGLPNYLDNSPILKAEGVNTPLLSWTGENDRHVNYLQSVEFYLALRRLGKEHTLLIYPNEEHVIINKKKQVDLSKRIEDWFDHYLKNEKFDVLIQSNSSIE